jgi:hypothetical protein
MEFRVMADNEIIASTLFAGLSQARATLFAARHATFGNYLAEFTPETAVDNYKRILELLSPKEEPKPASSRPRTRGRRATSAWTA